MGDQGDRLVGLLVNFNWIKTLEEKAETILQIQSQKKLKKWDCLAAVKYYRDIWPHTAVLLNLLTNRIESKSFIWTNEIDASFKEMKALMAADCLMIYPIHNLGFSIYTDASDYQIKDWIMQARIPVAYCSQKLNNSKKNYTTIKKNYYQ